MHYDLVQMEEMINDIEDVSDNKLDMMGQRKNITKIKEDITNAEKELDAEIKKLTAIKSRFNVINEKVIAATDDSAENNINDILTNYTVTKVLALFDAEELFSAEEAVYFVNNKITANNISDLSPYAVFSFYKVAGNLSTAFKECEEDILVNQIYNEFKAEADIKYEWGNHGELKAINDNIELINSRNYLPNTFKDKLVKKLEALRILYSLK